MTVTFDPASFIQDLAREAVETRRGPVDAPKRRKQEAARANRQWQLYMAAVAACDAYCAGADENPALDKLTRQVRH